MNNKLPIKKKVSFIDKIKNFFKSFFKKDNFNNIEQTDNLINADIKLTDNFQDSLKMEIKNQNISKDENKEEFLEQLENNPELLYELPIEKLRKIEEYYDELIIKYSENLKRIKA